VVAIEVTEDILSRFMSIKIDALDDLTNHSLICQGGFKCLARFTIKVIYLPWVTMVYDK
jgi:hypothetical protein